jgi:hypothetical protein
MSVENDAHGEMLELSERDELVDALLGGRIGPHEAPPGYALVAEWVQAATAPPSEDELAREPELVAAITSIARQHQPRQRSGVVRRLAPTKAIAATAVLVLGGGAAAAATGAFPAAVQRPLAHGLAALGISIPAPRTPSAPSNAGTSTSPSGAPQAPCSSHPPRNVTAGSPSHAGRSARTSCSNTGSPGGTNPGVGTGVPVRTGVPVTTGPGPSTPAAGATTSPPSGTGSNASVVPGSVSTPPNAAALPGEGSGNGTTGNATSGTSPGPPSYTPSGNTPGPPASTPSGNTPGPPASTPSGNTPGPPASTPSGNTPGPPASTPSGNTPGPPWGEPPGAASSR